jgi:4-deoxy-L-threo-5-hexosulose-uronate ketol-isomerase
LGEALELTTDPVLRSEFFLDRRELGVLSIGGRGAVTVDGERIETGKLDCVYVGRGSRLITFSSEDPASPAVFYLLSYPAHTAYPTACQRFSGLQGLPLGSTETCNRRTVYKAIFDQGLRSCQLVMGFTLLEPGSNWNTMPPHTHERRSEIYVYFDLPEQHRVIHLMGPPTETRHLVIADREIVVSPGWSIHAGVGTSHYAFCWGMGGENQAYDDMDGAPIATLR